MFAIFFKPPADPTYAEWPLLGSAWTITIIELVYVLFVLKVGRKFMENREPYNIKNLIIIYNLSQVFYNAALFSFVFYYLFIEPIYDLSCMESLPLEHPSKNIERWLSYAYYINKITDLLDTIFFVLRKSYKQVSVLHVYHHILMTYALYWVLRLYGSGGQYMMLTKLNSFVHTIMYFYYFICAMYPQMRANLWWKKYITTVQLVQFIILLSQAVIVLTLNPSCQFPLFLQYFQIFQSVLMILMFGNFYRKTYLKSQKQKQKIK